MNYREIKTFKKLKNKGYEVYHKGFPDFLVYNEKTNKLIFVEVKRKLKRMTKKMGLSKHQHRVIDILKKFIPVEIWYID